MYSCLVTGAQQELRVQTEGQAVGHEVVNTHTFIVLYRGREPAGAGGV